MHEDAAIPMGKPIDRVDQVGQLEADQTSVERAAEMDAKLRELGGGGGTDASARDEVRAPVTPTDAPGSLVLKSKSPRKDRGRLHAVRHGVLSRHPLEALRQLGEDSKSLRRLERRFREDLKPQGAIGEMLFDRFWSSYLRCLLIARTEASAFLRRENGREKTSTHTTTLIDGDLPTLVEQSLSPALMHELLESGMLDQLALIQRYDRQFGNEMYKALGLLLVVRGSGEAGLERALAHILGIEV